MSGLNRLSEESVQQAPAALRSRRCARSRNRRGAAAVELAVCLPALLILLFGSIEISNMIHLDHRLTTASYEGIREAIHFDANNASVRGRCQEVIDARGIQGATVSLDPADVAVVPRGEPITVTVTAPCTANSILPAWFFAGRSMEAASIMVKE